MAKLEVRPPKKTYITDQQALDFHTLPVPGKLSLLPTKPMATQRDLSLAYSPVWQSQLRRSLGTLTWCMTTHLKVIWLL